MLVVETIAKIRRLSLVHGKSIKAICRELKVSRKVVRKVLRSGETEFRYERKHQPYPRMDAWRDELDRLLSANASKSQRERLTLIRVFEELRGLGYDGSYSSVWRHAQSWEEQRGSASAEAYIPLSFAPGEAYQYDWSHGRGDGYGEGRAYAALPQPHVLRAGLSARESGDGVRRT